MPYAFNIFTGDFDYYQSGTAPVANTLLLEDNTDILLEDGTSILLEA